MSTLGEIFDIPEGVHQGDFVMRLAEGLKADRRKQTLEQYVVTPQLVQCFDSALDLIGSAVLGGSSKGAYLHGSFGSGKSHFMAVLDLILEGNADARAISELAAVVSKHNRWWEGRKFLVVPFHLIGAESMESAILGGYAAFVRQKHPQAPTPGFYRSAELIADAQRLREQMGDSTFFARLAGNAASDGWGAIGAGWDAASFDAAVAAVPDDSEHQRLVGDLIDAFFGYLKNDPGGSRFVSLDRGLAILSQHAHALGYAGVVLFLDELILWLASHSQDQVFLNREGQKVSKLVEAGDAGRPIPIISFIARQRDLRELVGAAVPGAQQLAFADVLQFWEARFDKIVLEDRNLPAIIERRLLRVRGPEQKQALRSAFERTAKVRQEVLDALLTSDGDKRMFEQVYPFSPALVQVLVALSGLLQRERTALKLMLQLLVNNKNQMQLGEVIPVGDLFDVIMKGDEPFTAVVKNLFDRARELWQRKLLPLLEAEHGITELDLGGTDVDPAVLRRWRTDAGLLKTLLLSALTPEVEAVRALTPLRLAALNHGTVRSPLPNGEAGTVLNKVRNWASRIGEIQISADSGNPLISLQLSGVDVEGIVENARSIDNFGNRVRTVRELLFGDLGLELAQATAFPEYQWLWRGTVRRVELLLQNVRECSEENLRPAEGAWRVVIDYPFDEGEHNPKDDVAKLNDFRERGTSVQTLVWLPSFLNARAMGDLGRLGVLNHVLSGNRLEEYAAHLQPGERQEARVTLKNQRDQLDQQVRAMLKQAYGIAQGNDSAIHTTHALDEHFNALYTGLRLQPPPGGGFRESLDHLLDQALSHQCPAHPKFEIEVRRPGLRRAWAVLEKAVDAADGRAMLPADRNQREEVRKIVEPLQLATCGEGHLVMSDYWRKHFTQKLAAAGVSSPTVRQLRQWIDEPRRMGLPDEVADLIIQTWAAQAGRSAWLHGSVLPIELGALNRECELREQSLPAEPQWRRAVELAQHVFGDASAASRNAGNVAALAQNLHAHALRHLGGMREYQQALQRRLDAWGLDHEGARARTAAASVAMLIALSQNQSAAERIAALASAQIESSMAAMGALMTRHPQLVQTLGSSQWDVLNLMRSNSSPGAKRVVDEAIELLQADEHVTGLHSRLASLHTDALQLLATEAPVVAPIVPPPDQRPMAVPVTGGEGRSADLSRKVQRSRADLRTMREAVMEVERLLAADPKLVVDVEFRCYRADDAGVDAS